MSLSYEKINAEILECVANALKAMKDGDYEGIADHLHSAINFANTGNRMVYSTVKSQESANAP